MKASRGLLPASAREPAVVGMPVVSMLSLTITGMPSRERRSPCRRARCGRRRCRGGRTRPARFAAADAALERGDFAAAEAEFDVLLKADPADAEAKAGKAQAGLLARASALDPQAALTAAAAPDATVADHLAAADLELATGRVDEAFDRLIGQIKVRTGPERDEVRVRLLALFDTVGNADPRVLKARRALMTALF